MYLSPVSGKLLLKTSDKILIESLEMRSAQILDISESRANVVADDWLRVQKKGSERTPKFLT